MFGIEVLNQHERHAGIAGQMIEQIRECLESAARCAYPNDNGAVCDLVYHSLSRHDEHAGRQLNRL